MLGLRCLPVPACGLLLIAACDANSSSDGHARPWWLDGEPDAQVSESEEDAGGAEEDPVSVHHTCTETEWLISGGQRTLEACDADGACSYDLSTGPTIVLDTSTCLEHRASLVAYDARGQLVFVVNATLKPEVWREADMLGSEIDRDNLPDSTACDSCTEGSQSIMLNTSERQAKYEFTPGQPPEFVARASTYVQALIDELLSCEGSRIADCTRGAPL
jgi:hypothetical protein